LKDDQLVALRFNLRLELTSGVNLRSSGSNRSSNLDRIKNGWFGRRFLGNNSFGFGLSEDRKRQFRTSYSWMMHKGSRGSEDGKDLDEGELHNVVGDFKDWRMI
jgi:hypothetical protein